MGKYLLPIIVLQSNLKKKKYKEISKHSVKQNNKIKRGLNDENSNNPLSLAIWIENHN